MCLHHYNTWSGKKTEETVDPFPLPLPLELLLLHIYNDVMYHWTMNRSSVEVISEFTNAKIMSGSYKG